VLSLTSRHEHQLHKTSVHRLVLQVGSNKIAIELDAARAPGLVEAIVHALPHATLAAHCQVAGAEFCVPVPFFHWHENRRIPTPGDVGYASFGNYLCFYYGEMAAGDGPTNVVGRVASDDSLLACLGQRLLKEGAQRASLYAAAEFPSGEAALGRPADSHMAKLSRALLESSLIDPPEDIVHLRSVALPAMGNIAARMQASVLLLSLAEVIMNARMLVLNAPASLGQVVAGLSNQLGRYARWLAMAGMPGLARWLATAQVALRPPPSELTTLGHDLEEALVAIARLRFWAEAISPWHKVDGDYRDSDSTWSSVMSKHSNESVE
jgi:hypothetical protein